MNSKVIVGMLVGLMLVGINASAVVDPIAEEWKAISDKVYGACESRDYAGALKACEKFKQQHPNEWTNSSYRTAGFTIIDANWRAGMRDAAITTAREMLNDLVLQHYSEYLHGIIGVILQQQGKLEESVIDFKNSGDTFLLDYARSLSSLGKHEDAQVLIMRRVLNVAQINPANGAESPPWVAFNQLNFTYISDIELKKFLANVIKITPAITVNAEFLGRLKSELEKMK